MKSSRLQGGRNKSLLNGLVFSVLVLGMTGTSPEPSSAQSGVRIGVTLGGISKASIALEHFFNGNQSWELTIGTWSFKEVSTAFVIKRYFLKNHLDTDSYRPIHPFMGAGLWIVGQKPAARNLGFAISAIVPIGIDWNFPFDSDQSCNDLSCPSGHNALGVSINLNRALVVRRPNPDDNLPLNGRLVPLPAVYYRFLVRH